MKKTNRSELVGLKLPRRTNDQGRSRIGVGNEESERESCGGAEHEQGIQSSAPALVGERIVVRRGGGAEGSGEERGDAVVVVRVCVEEERFGERGFGGGFREREGGGGGEVWGNE